MDTLQIIAEPRRREILRLIWAEEMAASEIAGHFDVTFGAVSQHLGLLRAANLVEIRQDGNRRFYRADHDMLAPYKEVLEAMWATTLSDLARVIEEGEA